VLEARVNLPINESERRIEALSFDDYEELMELALPALRAGRVAGAAIRLERSRSEALRAIGRDLRDGCASGLGYELTRAIVDLAVRVR
jgi:hypothetical protein